MQIHYENYKLFFPLWPTKSNHIACSSILSLGLGQGKAVFENQNTNIYFLLRGKIKLTIGCISVVLKLRTWTNWFFTAFWFFDRNFGALGIEILKIRFQIRILRPRIMLNPNFQLITWKIADFKRNCWFFLNHSVGTLSKDMAPLG